MPISFKNFSDTIPGVIPSKPRSQGLKIKEDQNKDIPFQDEF
jgi:hypothetical protein